MTIEAQVLRNIEVFKQNLRKSGKVLEGEMHNIVAIKTGNLDKSIATDPIIEVGSKIIIAVGTHNVEYAKFVEDGSGGVKNYHRRGSIVYTGYGQKFAQRALQRTKNEIAQIMGISISANRQ